MSFVWDSNLTDFLLLAYLTQIDFVFWYQNSKNTKSDPYKYDPKHIHMETEIDLKTKPNLCAVWQREGLYRIDINFSKKYVAFGESAIFWGFLCLEETKGYSKIHASVSSPVLTHYVFIIK